MMAQRRCVVPALALCERARHSGDLARWTRGQRVFRKSEYRFCEQNTRKLLAGFHLAGKCSGANEEDLMRKLLLITGLLALAIGLLWIGQGTGAINWPASSFMIKQLQWAGYGAALAALGLILIWQSKR